MTRSNGMRLRAGMCLAFLFVLLSHALPAAAQNCVLYYDAPSGGGSPTSPITARGNVQCSSPTPVDWTAYNFSAYLYKSGTVSAVASNWSGLNCYMTFDCFATAPVSTPCVAGSYSVSVVAGYFGTVFVNPVSGVSSSNWVNLSCTPPPPIVDYVNVTTGWSGPGWGFNAGVPMGSVSPTTTSNGKTYRAIADVYNWWTGTQESFFGVCGFSSAPTKEWLASVVVGSTTKVGSAAYLFGYESGCAYWHWYGNFGINTTNGGVTQVTVTHN
jgi:hypothetical protein